jgi:hypothetical protein
MTTEIETGGLAFPILAEQAHDERAAEGMTLRDYMAAKALPDAIKHWTNDDNDEPEGGAFEWSCYEITEDCRAAAELSYRMADAMLEARKS